MSRPCKITDLIDWISLLWVSKVNTDYTKFASGDYLSYKFVTNNYTVHGETKMLINSGTVFKLLQLCTFMLFFFSLSILIQICVTQFVWSPKVKFTCIIELHFR